MNTPAALPWLALFLLGAGHGLNPGMGWLFAVALGLQEGRAAAVWLALGPLALGHALAVVLAVLVALAAGVALPAGALRWVVAALLVGLGVARLIRHRHPAGWGMRVNARELTTWSLLMATAHGAGLMVVPVALAGQLSVLGDEGHGAHQAASQAAGDGATALWSGLAHTAGYLLVTGVIAVVVYRKVGLRLLRSAWINLDLIWAGALLITGLVTPFI